MESNITWLSMCKDRLVVPDVVSSKSLITPKHIFTPQVGVRAALMHSSIRFKIILDVKFIFLKGQFYKFGISVFS